MGELIDLNSQIPDSRIPAAIARDSETTAAINAHVAAANPHPVYLTQAEGDGRYLYIEGSAENSWNLRGLLVPLEGVSWERMRLGALSGTQNVVSVHRSAIADYAESISPEAMNQVLRRFDVQLNLPFMPIGFRQSFFVPGLVAPISIDSAYQGFFLRNMVPNGERNIRIQPVFVSSNQINIWIENLSGVSLPPVANARIRVVMF